ncbi:RDD family protein [Streptomyces sp. NPDC001868]|uniref:RDD family protein n=1 Tax=Streptomyces sp. NPDC001868 TaxID=3154401 RepID=UPI00332C96F6
MSAPTPAPGDDRPREGYYPDPSIPGYVRYWNGAAWVPGTSRPAPSDGEPLAPPPGSGPSGAVEETGPHFFDEDPAPDGESGRPADKPLHGIRPEPASAWGADRSRQTGFGGDKDRRVSWGSPPGADPRVSLAADPGDTGPGASGDSGPTASTDGTATIPPAEAGEDAGAPQGTVVFRRPDTSPRPQAAEGAEPLRSDGTMSFRPSAPRAGDGGAPASPAAFRGPLTPAQIAAQQALGLAPQSTTAASAPSGPQQGPTVPQQGPQSGGVAPAAPAAVAPAAPVAPAPRQPEPQQASFGAAFPQQALQSPQVPQNPQIAPAAPAPQIAQPAPGVPQQAAAPQSSEPPMAVGSGGGQPSWAQQVHRLAGGEGEQPVAPWKPVVEDPFQAAARRQSEARPAGLGRRLAARLVDSLVVGAVTAVAAVPFGTKAMDHIDEKIDTARLSGERVTVWLVDGTTSVYFGIILGVLFLVSALYEVLPTAKWGRTLGKRLLGLDVRDIEGHEPPSFGRSLRRWLVHTVSGLLGVGVVGVLWCVWDKPWRQCWHDKAAHTFVAGK